MSDHDSESDADWERRLREKRAEKDDFFATHRQSPVPPEKRDGFDGLAYFDPDRSYRVEATVHREDDPETVEMDTSDDRTMTYRRPFRFQFDLGGKRYELSGYRQEPTDPIFVPFRDKTTGQQSYEDGRYMELQTDEDPADGETIVIDFNLAYSPFCAYSDTFSCPLPPEENWLETTITAGEREPPL